jgi:hypothetical protein
MEVKHQKEKTNNVVRKKPGRPRKRPTREKIPRNGIAQSPNKDTNAMELIYDSPESFKKIFAMFKSMDVDVLKIMFDTKQVVLSTTDHYGKSIIHVIIDATRINHYYCLAPFSIMLNAKNMESIIKVLDGSYVTVTFVSKINEQNKKIHIVYKNDMKIDEYRDLDLIDVGNIPPNVTIDDSKYQIKFVLPSRFFKKMICDISSFTDVLTFEKAGRAGPLSYTYINVDQTLRNKHVVKDPNHIKMECNMEESDIFGTTIILDYVKALSGSLISENIKISADTNHEMIFQSVINDGDITVKIMTTTVNLK